MQICGISFTFAKTKENKMNTTAINRDYLNKIFSTMNSSDTTWAIKTLTERLHLFGQAVNEETSTLLTIDHAFAQLKDMQEGKLQGIPAESIVNEL